jgi:asparagine synthetase B (glutamine-hydrolysing)
MCGIAGILRLTDKPINQEQIKSLLLGIEERGGDATGIAMMTDGKLTVHKNDAIAWQYLSQKGFKDYIEENLKPTTQSVILHTRAWTTGSPHINANNHPLHSGKSAIVHNGMISNHTFLFNDMKLKRGAETDSDIIRAIVDKEGLNKKTIRSLNRLSGSCASAILHPDHPKKVMLLRSGSPLVLAHDGDHIMWASTKKALHLAARQWKRRNGIWFQANRAELMFNPMAEESAWILDADEMIAHAEDADWAGPWHDRFASCSHYTAPNYRTHDRYAEKQARKAAEAAKDDSKEEPQKPEGVVAKPDADKGSANVPTAVDVAEKSTDGEAPELRVKCTNASCGMYLNVPARLQNVPLNMLQCNECKKPLTVN